MSAAYQKFAYVYDRLMDDVPYWKWVQFAEAAWRKRRIPQTVVDLGCGTGNIAIPLAHLGYRVTGIDLSEDMLAVAEQKGAYPGGLTATRPVEWLQQDIRDWELPEPVDAVISFCDCFNYLLEHSDVEAGFDQAFHGLKPGGTFLFDVHTPAQLRAYMESQPFVLNDDDISYIWTSELDETNMIIEHDLSIFSEQPESGLYARIDEKHIQRAYPLDWLRTALERAGFQAIECFADFTFDPIGPQTERAFFVAVRP